MIYTEINGLRNANTNIITNSKNCQQWSQSKYEIPRLRVCNDGELGIKVTKTKHIVCTEKHVKNKSDNYWWIILLES